MIYEAAVKTTKKSLATLMIAPTNPSPVQLLKVVRHLLTSKAKPPYSQDLMISCDILAENPSDMF